MTAMPSVVTIGSSDVASILGYRHHDASAWKTWARLVGLVPRYDAERDDEALAGDMFEPAIGMRFAREQGLQLGTEMVVGPPIGMPPIIGPEPWMAARPDFMIYGATGQLHRLLECKAPRVLEPQLWGEPGTSHVPRYYLCQTCWQMAVLPTVEVVDLAAFGRVTSDWRVYRIERRERAVSGIVAAVRDWYERYVLTVEPPPIDDSLACARLLAELYPAPAAKEWRPATEADRALARDILRLRGQIEAIEPELALLENRMRERIGDAYGIRGVARWPAKKGAETIDAKRLRRDHPALAAQYAKAGKPGRTLTITFTENEDAAD